MPMSKNCSQQPMFMSGKGSQTMLLNTPIGNLRLIAWLNALVSGIVTGVTNILK